MVDARVMVSCRSFRQAYFWRQAGSGLGLGHSLGHRSNVCGNASISSKVRVLSLSGAPHKTARVVSTSRSQFRGSRQRDLPVSEKFDNAIFANRAFWVQSANL